MSEEIERNRTAAAPLLAGWICLALGILFMFLSLATFFLYGPLFLVAFILSIVAMAKGSVARGVALLLMVLIIPSVLGIGLVAHRVGGAITDLGEYSKKPSPAQSISISEVKGFIDGDYMYLKGKITNYGTETFRYVKVGVNWYDNNGRMLDTDYTYAVGAEGLAPKATKSFEIMTKADNSMANYNYYIMEE
jgi:hypothetical protein